MADLLARRVFAEMVTLAPDRADRLVADLAAHPEVWDRHVLVAAVGHRLTEADRHQLTETDEPSRLVEVMSAAGVLAAATMLRVLHAEGGVEAAVAAGLVPATGMATPEAIRMLHDTWGGDRLEMAALLGATAEELRSAGCTPVEMLAAAPRETLRSLDARESTWQRVGLSLLEAGYSEAQAVAHLAAHAPTPATLAAGVMTSRRRPAYDGAHRVAPDTTRSVAGIVLRPGAPPGTAERLSQAAFTPPASGNVPPAIVNVRRIDRVPALLTARRRCRCRFCASLRTARIR